MITKIGLYKDPRKQKPWVVRWYGEFDPATGKQRRYSKSFHLKRDAEEFQNQQIAAFNKGQQRDRPEEITLKDFCGDWLRTKRVEFRPETVMLYENAIVRLTDYFGANCLLSRISPWVAAKFIAEQKRLDGRDDELSNWARHRTLRNCKTMFQDAVTWELIPRNPFTGVKAPKCITRSWHYVQPEEFARLLNASNGKYSVRLRHRAFYALAYCCGLRYGEVVNLTWQYIDFENAVVRINNRPATAILPSFSVKDAESRTVPVPQHCLDILIDLKNYNDATDQTPYVVLDDRQYQTVMAKWQRFKQQRRSWRNRDMQNNALTTFKRHVKWAGIQQNGTLAIHTLRKSCIQNWANNITNPEVVRVLAGHADLQTTMKYYAQADSEQMEKAAAVIDALLSKADARMTPGTNFNL
jgi:integrase